MAAMLLAWKRIARLLPLLGLLAGAARAQLPPPMRLGEPTAEDFDAQPMAGDTTAAVVLCDYGTAHYEDYSGVLHLVHERMVRLKVLGPAGYRYAQVQVPLYNRYDGNDHLSNLRGCTYVRQPDDSVRQTPLDARNVYTEQVTYRRSIRRFALPGVQAGAVIEYAYTVSVANGGKLPDWNFQWSIPVRWSEYQVNFPRILRYHLVYQGYLPLTREEADLQATAQLTQGGSTVVPAEAHRWVVRDAPALRAEPFQPALDAYRTPISCELVGVQWPGQPLRNLGSSWAQKCQELRTSEYFGKVLEHDGFLPELMQPLRQFHSDPAERAVAVRDLVQQRVRSDGPFRWWTGTALRRTWEQRQGSCADVNLLLVAALRQAGLRASPVLLSTTSREALELAHLDSFDYVLALVELPVSADSTAPRELLLDATEPLLSASVLPQHCVGRPGHTVPAEGAGRWLQLPATTGSTRYQDVKMTLDAQGNLRSQVREELSGYAAQAGRRRLDRLGAKGVAAELLATHPDWEVSDLEPVAAANLRQPLGWRYTLRQPAPGLTSGPELYVQPLAAFLGPQNPFVSAERRFPVDFGRQQQEVVILTLTLPPGYVAELPPPLALVLPGQGGRYVYSASSPAPGTVQLISRLTLDKLTYTPQEYHALRELYGQMLARQAHALVVRKKNR